MASQGRYTLAKSLSEFIFEKSHVDNEDHSADPNHIKCNEIASDEMHSRSVESDYSSELAWLIPENIPLFRSKDLVLWFLIK